MQYEISPSLYGNPSISRSECSWSIEAAGELLYLQPFEEGLSYAIRNDVRQTASGADGTPGGAILDLKSEWQPAFRLMIGYAPDVTVRLLWMVFFATTERQAQTNLFPTGIGLQGTWIPAIDSSVLYSSARFRWKLDFQTLDLELGKRYAVSPFISFNPVCCIRFALIDQAFHAFYGSSDQVSAMNDFRGVGPRIALNSSWGFAHGWEIIASGAACILYGQFTMHDGFSTSTVPAETLINDVDEQFNRSIATADLSLGLGWGRSLARNRWHLGVRLSYETHLFWDQNELHQPLGSDAPALAILQSRDLSIHGFALRTECEF